MSRARNCEADPSFTFAAMNWGVLETGSEARVAGLGSLEAGLKLGLRWQ